MNENNKMKSTEINEINNNLGLMVNNKGILKDIVIISMINEINVVENVSFILSKSLKRNCQLLWIEV